MSGTRSEPVTVALVNDYELVLHGLAAMLAPYRSIEVVELDVERPPRARVDVALYDTYGRAQLGLDRVESLAQVPNVGRVAVYTWELSADQRAAALRAGATGLLSKSMPSPDLVDALRRIAGGATVVSDAFHAPSAPSWPGSELGLTLRESEVAALLAQGLSNREIADALVVSENTVKSHLKSIFAKAMVTTRSQAIVRITSDAAFARRRVA